MCNSLKNRVYATLVVYLCISCAEPRKQREESQTCLNYPESRPRKTIVNVPLEEVEKCLKEMDV